MIACFRGCGRDGRIEAYQLETFTTSERSMPQTICQQNLLRLRKCLVPCPWMASLAARFLSWARGPPGPGPAKVT